MAAVLLETIKSSRGALLLLCERRKRRNGCWYTIFQNASPILSLRRSIYGPPVDQGPDSSAPLGPLAYIEKPGRVAGGAEIVLPGTTVVLTLRVGATPVDERSGDGLAALLDSTESLLEIRDEITRLLQSNVEPHEASAIVLPRPVKLRIEDRE